MESRPTSILGLSRHLAGLYFRKYPALRATATLSLLLSGAIVAALTIPTHITSSDWADVPAFSVNTNNTNTKSVTAEPHVAAEREPHQAPALSILASASGIARVGETLPIEIAVKNVGAKPVSVLRSLDGSDYGWRAPRIAIEIRSADGSPVKVPRQGRCGNTNPLTGADFLTLAPGESTDLFASSFSHYMLAWTPDAPGRYMVTLTYDLRFEEHESEAASRILATLEHPMPAGVFYSETLELEVVDE